MNARVTATLAGWLVGALMAVYVVVPWAAEVIHHVDDVYETPSDVTVSCLPNGQGVVEGASFKRRDFAVIPDEEPGYIRINYNIDGVIFGQTYPLVRPDGDIVPTRPTYAAGDRFQVGPFRYPALPSTAVDVNATVVLPGYRFGILRTAATLGPMRVINCNVAN